MIIFLVVSARQWEESWEERFNELVGYKEKTGNCNVSQSQGALGNWMNTQRQIYNKENLSQERTIQLEDIGFNWGTRKQKSHSERWEERFKELVGYKEKTCNYNVPKRQGALGRWVQGQRRLYKKGKLPQERTT